MRRNRTKPTRAVSPTAMIDWRPEMDAYLAGYDGCGLANHRDHRRGFARALSRSAYRVWPMVRLP